MSAIPTTPQELPIAAEAPLEASAAPPAAAPPATPEVGGTLGLVDLLLRDRAALLQRIEAGQDLAGIARTMILTIMAAAGVFGAAVGWFRGGEQILYAALKFPLVLLLTAALCAPAYSVIKAVVAGAGEVRRDFALTLSSLALGALFMAASAPVLLLAIMLEINYHALTLLTVACCSVGGLVGTSLFFRGIQTPRLSQRAGIGFALFIVVALVGSQMSWTLRPYLVRPADESIPFVRSIEGSFFDAVGRSLISSLGYFPEADRRDQEERQRIEYIYEDARPIDYTPDWRR